MAVHGVIAEDVLFSVAVDGATTLRSCDRQSSPVAHCGAERPCIKIEVERDGGNGIQPIAGSERELRRALLRTSAVE